MRFFLPLSCYPIYSHARAHTTHSLVFDAKRQRLLYTRDGTSYYLAPEVCPRIMGQPVRTRR